MPRPTAPAKATAGTFGRRLAALREHAGLSRYALARAAGLTTTTITSLETGRHEPSYATACALADALGIGLESFRP